MAKGRSRLMNFLLFFCIACVYSEPVYVKAGTNYTFTPSVKGDISQIDWRYMGNLVVEWHRDNQPTPHWYKHKDRASLDTKTGVFTLRDMKKEDSGLYKGQFTVNEIKYLEVQVNVVEPLVSKPKVTCEKNDTNITLVCSVVGPVQTFLWSGPSDFTTVGNSVHIPINPNSDSLYFCTAKNEVSEVATEFRLSNCTTGKPNQNDDTFGIIFGILVPLVILAIGGVIGYQFINKNKMDNRPGTSSEKEELRETRQNTNNESNHTSDRQTSIDAP